MKYHHYLKDLTKYIIIC